MGLIDEEIPWIEWFIQLKGNEYFVEVDEDYIQDDFNLTGLSTQVPYYESALNMILDFDDPNDELPEVLQALVGSAAQRLYGLIHARFIITNRGMQLMSEKYDNHIYGMCQLVECEEQHQAVLPCGMYDAAQCGPAMVFCPCCQEIYRPRQTRLQNIDGAYFGTTFAGFFIMTFPQRIPKSLPEPYVPRLYGFKIHRGLKEMLRKNKENGRSLRNGPSQQEGQ